MSADIYCVEAPSNIALLKYWGKKDSTSQWPANDSLSMTLQGALTSTRAWVNGRDQHAIFFEDHFRDPSDPSWRKCYNHLEWIAAECQFTKKVTLESRNSFPISCGIASSASGLLALTMAALASWTNSKSMESLVEKGFGKEEIARLARMGSGSACRSISGGFVQWQSGENASTQRVVQVHDHEHWQLADIIVLISERPKDVSSSMGHEFAWSSPLFPVRLEHLDRRMEIMLDALARKDIQGLGEAIEAEALEMHAVMMSSTPPLNFFEAETTSLIAEIRRFRKRTGVPVYFTIDAGPNVHLICEKAHIEDVCTFLSERFPALSHRIDQVGKGPTLSVEQSND